MLEHQRASPGGQVVDVCVGRTVPEVTNFRALPSPDSTLWPQFQVDVCYRGAAMPLSGSQMTLIH